MKLIAILFCLYVIREGLGCIPTTENKPSTTYPECACSKPEMIAVFATGVGYSTTQASPNDCKTFTFACSNQAPDILPGKGVNIHFNGQKVAYTDMIKRIELTCDPTTRTYSAEGHTGIKALGCSNAGLEDLGVAPEEIAAFDAAAAGSGAAGAIGTCGSCDPKKISVQSLTRGPAITQTVSADCNTITWNCETFPNNFVQYLLVAVGGAMSPVVVPNSNKATVTATCDGNGNYLVDGFDQPVRAISCGFAPPPAGK